ncbi:MAG: ABC transporter ATP-binding protein [Vicinamibacterales bacterium]
MGTRPDPRIAGIGAAAWPLERVHDALAAIGTRHGLKTETRRDAPALPSGDHELARWIEDTSARCGLQADRTFAALEELGTLLKHGAPLLLRLSSLEGAPFLAIVGSRRGAALAIAPDGRERTLSVPAIVGLLRQPFEAPLEAPVNDALTHLALTGRRRERARTSLLRDRLMHVRFRGCWLLRLPPGSALVDEAAESRLGRRIATLTTAYLGQYACFVGSWWLLGRAVLDGTVSRGWLFGWALLLASLLPLRLLVTWEQGLLTVSLGAWLRRRLLRGAFLVNRQLIRQKGVGELFTLVMEAAALDAMALSGGLAAAFAAVEVTGAAVVLWWGATAWLIAALAVWVMGTTLAAWRYFVGRRAWTAQRLAMTHQLLETMMGHRTRIIQQRTKDRHLREDESLDQALMLGEAMDRAGAWLIALMPRGWLVVGLAAIVPVLATGAAPGALAVSLGGILLAYRALQRLAGGLTQLTGAIVAATSVSHLAKAAAPAETPLVASATPKRPRHSEEPVLVARDLVFRYRPQGTPVVSGATLSVEPGARLLLEGASGSGKTTFGALLAGLEHPESGLLLAGGLDRSALGSSGWHSRVVMAPQAHDNYMVGASLAFNLLMGRRWPADPGDIAEAENLCRALGLGDLIDRLPGGLDQVVGETGWQLSQGERVRVFLARALLQRPEVLVLDESFSALDPDNIARAARAAASSGSAVLAIAHL